MNKPDFTSPLAFVRSLKWRYKLSGREIETGCPFKKCPNQGQNQFYINQDTGSYYCHRCESKGSNLKQLAYKLELIKEQDPHTSTHIYVSEKEIEDMYKALVQNKSALLYLTQTRGFGLNTIKYFKLGYKQLADGEVIVIPYFDREGTCVGLKYNFFKAPAGVPKMKFEQGSKIQLFNLNNVDMTKPLVITEGEYDAITAWQYGQRNTGSIPNGASGINGWTNEIDQLPMYYVCFDNDQAGQKGAAKLGEALGLSRCFRVHPPLKDLNECLQCRMPKEKIDKAFKNPKPMFNPPSTALINYVAEAVQEINNPDVEKGDSTGWSSIDYVWGGVRTNEITSLTGATGNGKSTWGKALIGNLARTGKWKFLIISGEEKGSKVLRQLANQHYKAIATEQQVADFAKAYGNVFHVHNIYNSWETNDRQLTTDTIFNLIEYYIRSCGVNFVFIDHVRLFIKQGDKEHEDIGKFMERSRKLVMKNPVHLLLVVQPRKLAVGQTKVRMADLKGSVNFEQDSWNVITIHRANEESHTVEFEVEKNREYGRLGPVNLGFDMDTRADYYEIRE
jgi:twinkle protein